MHYVVSNNQYRMSYYYHRHHQGGGGTQAPGYPSPYHQHPHQPWPSSPPSMIKRKSNDSNKRLVAPTSTSNANSRILDPNHNDILLGRGGHNNAYIGNENLRNLARAMRDVYIKSGKKQKSRMSRDLVAQIHALDPPGRFLKRNAITNEWEEVADEYAREKCSQCLRDAVSEMKGMDASSASAATTSSAGDVASPVIFPPAPANNTTPTPPTREKQLAYSSVMSTPRASNLTTKKNVSTFAHSDDDDIPLMPPLISSDLPFQKRARTNTADDNVHAHTGSSDHDNNRDQEESRQEVDANSSPADQYNIPLFAAGGGDSDSSLPTASFDHCEQDFALFQEDDFLNDCMGSMDLGRVDDAPGTATEMTSTTKDDPSYEFCTEFF